MRDAPASEPGLFFGQAGSMVDEWSVVGAIAAGLVALLVALGRGWLIPRAVVEQNLEQWQSRLTEMTNDRDYWRERAHRNRDRAYEAVELQKEANGDAS